MGMGVIIGVFWGLVTAGAIVAMLSLSAPLPPRPDAIPQVMDNGTGALDTPEAEAIAAPEAGGLPTEAGANVNPVAGGDTDAETIASGNSPAPDGATDMSAAGGETRSTSESLARENAPAPFSNDNSDAGVEADRLADAQTANSIDTSATEPAIETLPDTDADADLAAPGGPAVSGQGDGEVVEGVPDADGPQGTADANPGAFPARPALPAPAEATAPDSGIGTSAPAPEAAISAAPTPPVTLDRPSSQTAGRTAPEAAVDETARPTAPTLAPMGDTDAPSQPVTAQSAAADQATLFAPSEPRTSDARLPVVPDGDAPRADDASGARDLPAPVVSPSLPQARVTAPDPVAPPASLPRLPQPEIGAGLDRAALPGTPSRLGVTESSAEAETETDRPEALTDDAPSSLPQIGAAPTPVAAETAAADATEPAVPNALRDNAVMFEASPNRPLLAVVLIDTPDTRLTLETLTSFSFPVTFAVDPTHPEAAMRSRTYRDAGFEVVIGGDILPSVATPADVEIAFEAARTTLPQAVALMDTPDSRIQGDRPVLDATIDALGASGHGLIAFPQGLNAAEQSARRQDIPAATLFRLLDDEGQRATVITRYLSRAAFAAGSDGAVIVAGRTRPETVTALFSWALGSRPEGVVLAPLSAALDRLNAR